jgi:hypothetical protein
MKKTLSVIVFAIVIGVSGEWLWWHSSGPMTAHAHSMSHTDKLTPPNGSEDAQEDGQLKIWSPGGKMYAMRLPREQAKRDDVVESFRIHTADGKKVSMIYIEEPSRGCEDIGWIDARRFFCEGSINPSTVIYRYFDAISGKEIGERYGSDFTWSPDNLKIANFGNVPHFTDWNLKSDSLEIGKHRYPKNDDGERHLFHSGITWSPDSEKVAIVDHQIKKSAYHLVVVSITGKVFECRLKWNSADKEKDEYPAERDFKLQWNGNKIMVAPPGGGIDEEILVR